MDNRIRFRKSNERGSAINSRGKLVEFSKYDVFLDDKLAGSIEGFLRKGGTGWAIGLLGNEQIKNRQHYTLTSAKKAMARHFAKSEASDSAAQTPERNK